MNDLVWCERSAWWIPVHLVVESSGLNHLDPLERAVLDLVRVGVVQPRDIAHTLGLAPTFVVSAAGFLVSRRMLIQADDRFALPEAEQQVPEIELQVEDAWVVWDPIAKRVMPEIWKEPDAPEVPESDEHLREEGLDDAPGPKTGHLLEELATLTMRTDLSMLRRCGARTVIEGQPGIIRQIRPTRQRWLRRSCWVPVEVRQNSFTVWHPSVVPLDEVHTQLDPQGGRALDDLGATVLEALRARAQSLRAKQLPFLLKRTEYATFADLEAYASRRAGRELGSADHGCPERLRRAVVQALINEQLHEVVETDWRATAQSWADVLDVGTHHATNGVVELIRNAECPTRDQISQHRRLLDKSADPLLRALPKGWNELERKVTSDRTTLGERAFALATACVLDERLRQDVSRQSRFFSTLNRAIQSRNIVVHRRSEERDLDAGGFREDVLACTRWFATLPS